MQAWHAEGDIEIRDALFNSCKARTRPSMQWVPLQVTAILVTKGEQGLSITNLLRIMLPMLSSQQLA